MLNKQTQNALRTIYKHGEPEDRIDLEFQIINSKIDELFTQLYNLQASVEEMKNEWGIKW